MADKPDTDMDVQLNEAFARLEEQADKASAETPADDPAVGRGAKARPAARRSSQPSAAKSNVLAWLAMFLALVAIGLGSYASFIIYQEHQLPGTSDANAELSARLSDEIIDLRTQISEQSRRDETSVQTNDALRDQLRTFEQRQSERLNAMESSFDNALEQIDASSTTTGRDWLLAETEYLIRMANQRVLMDGDPVGASSLLASADRILVDAEDLTAHGVRQAIAQDQAALAAVGELDVEGYYLRLGAQVRMVSQLKRPEKSYTAATADSGAVAAESDGILVRVGRLVKRFGQALSGLVDFRRNMPEIVPILPPEEEYYLRQNLIFKLQLAQLGLLRERQEVFNTSVEDAMAWLDRYFDPEDSNTIAMRNSLGDMANISVARELPDVNRSLRAIRQLLTEFHTVTVP
jgi:uroporphyrin-III C-methyltransferase